MDYNKLKGLRKAIEKTYSTFKNLFGNGFLVLKSTYKHFYTLKFWTNGDSLTSILHLSQKEAKKPYTLGE